MPNIIAKYLGYFCKELCSQELSKITQSGHTDCDIKRKCVKAHSHWLYLMNVAVTDSCLSAEVDEIFYLCVDTVHFGKC